MYVHTEPLPHYLVCTIGNAGLRSATGGATAVPWVYLNLKKRKVGDRHTRYRYGTRHQAGILELYTIPTLMHEYATGGANIFDASH